MNPLVSVVLTYYKENEHQVHRSLGSIINQTYPNIEIIVVLDNPENELIIAIVRTYQEKYSNIIFNINEKNAGVSISRNIAIKMAVGEYVVFQDGDDYSYPDRIEKQVRFMQANQDIDLSGTGTVWKDENKSKYQFFFNDKRPVNERIKYYCPVVNGTLIAKRQSFEKYGYLPDKRKAEDYYFMVNWFLQGAKFDNLDEYLLDYYRDVSGANTRIREESIAGIKLRLKFGKKLKLEFKHYLKIFFYDIPFWILLPRKLVNYLAFLNNMYIKRNNRMKNT